MCVVYYDIEKTKESTYIVEKLKTRPTTGLVLFNEEKKNNQSDSLMLYFLHSTLES
jgi:hypothetical protein